MSTHNSKSSLRDKKQKQDVLKAILNVKKYAKNLKRNADTFYDRNASQEISQVVSNPSFFQSSKSKSSQQIERSAYQSFQPIIRNQIIFREPNIKVAKQKKQYSMASMPSSKREQYSAFTKLKNKQSECQYSEADSLREGTYSMKNSVSSRRPILSQSYKGQNLWPKIMRPTEDQKMFQKSAISNQERLQKNLGNQQELVKSMLIQIKKLKEQISLYKKALMAIRTKYKVLQQKSIEKVQSDHLIDVLKEKINNLQSTNCELSKTIELQNRQIKQFGEKTKNIVERIFEHFKHQKQKILKIQLQNVLLKKTFQSQLSHYDKQIPQAPILKNIGLSQSNSEDFLINQKKQSFCWSQSSFFTKYSSSPYKNIS